MLTLQYSGKSQSQSIGMDYGLSASFFRNRVVITVRLVLFYQVSHLGIGIGTGKSGEFRRAATVPIKTDMLNLLYLVNWKILTTNKIYITLENKNITIYIINMKILDLVDVCKTFHCLELQRILS